MSMNAADGLVGRQLPNRTKSGAGRRRLSEEGKGKEPDQHRGDFGAVLRFRLQPAKTDKLQLLCCITSMICNSFISRN
jgi:hypothetical protein